MNSLLLIPSTLAAKSSLLSESLLSGGGLQDSPIVYSLLLLIVALIPFVLLSITSFIKLSVVFSILRNALGGGQIPSAAVGTLLSLVLSFQIMAPVFTEAIQEIDLKRTFSSIEALQKDLIAAAEPIEKFLEKHSGAREREFFMSVSKESSFSLIPAFVVSELKEAFAIGFTVYLPFLIIDLVVANLLVGMGMMMVSPVTLSVPFKIALFVMCDGWFTLCSGLVLGYS